MPPRGGGPPAAQNLSQAYLRSDAMVTFKNSKTEDKIGMRWGGGKWSKILRAPSQRRVWINTHFINDVWIPKSSSLSNVLDPKALHVKLVVWRLTSPFFANSKISFSTLFCDYIFQIVLVASKFVLSTRFRVPDVSLSPRPPGRWVRSSTVPRCSSTRSTAPSDQRVCGRRLRCYCVQYLYLYIVIFGNNIPYFLVFCKHQKICDEVKKYQIY